MPRKLNFKFGQQVGTQTVLGPAPSEHGHGMWLVRCACGKGRKLRGSSIARFVCGCAEDKSDRDRIAQLETECNILRSDLATLMSIVAAGFDPEGSVLDMDWSGLKRKASNLHWEVHYRHSPGLRPTAEELAGRDYYEYNF